MSGSRILSTRTLYAGWGRYLLAHVASADGAVVRREIEDHGAAAAVLPYDPERRVALLVKQMRAPMLMAGLSSDLLEVPAGLLDGDEPAACAVREAREEVGVALSDPEACGASAPMPGISTERIHLFLCCYTAADRVGEGGGVASETESITVVELPLAELARLADAGQLVDMKTLVLLQTLRLRRPELFAASA